MGYMFRLVSSHLQALKEYRSNTVTGAETWMDVYGPKTEQLLTTTQESLPNSVQDISNVYHFLSIKEVCTMSTFQKVKV